MGPSMLTTTTAVTQGWVTADYVSKLHDTAADASAVPGPASAAAASLAKPLPYTRGFTIPSPEAWRDLLLMPAQLQDYTSCLDTTHPWDSKQPVVFWRGAATGCSRGWPAYTAMRDPAAASSAGASAAAAPRAGPELLRNKRIQLALRVLPFSGMFDVGITSPPRFMPECLGSPGVHEPRALLGLEQDNTRPEHGQLPTWSTADVPDSIGNSSRSSSSTSKQ